MRLRGVNYDVGRVLDGINWRPAYDPAETRRELEIIKNDLHCSAVKICGHDVGRIMATARHALDQGLEVWLSPELWDQDSGETLRYITEAARDAEDLCRRWPGRVVLSAGTELTLFMRGLLEGNSFQERITHPQFREHIWSGSYNEPLNAFLAAASNAVRRVFSGRLSYASLPFEKVDWSNFDFVGIDLYRDAGNRDRFPGLLQRYLGHGLPVVITEFGCCTYRGAEDAGGLGWAIIDFGQVPPRLNGDYVRDEAVQARELTALLDIFGNAGADGAFVHTFVSPITPYSEDPRYDFDMASYSLVKSYANRLGELSAGIPGIAELPWDDGQAGMAYPDMPWEPKESFRAIADFYRSAAEP
ncbi:MAG: hypothetical protein JOY82_22850 [Streptosporangiaceae bacterium]|nr:hypothetical protein [Streptosporangiaceae bacterium]MBV9857320.1 hypothetical protein [Streptosporangiaceae bacterium]